MLVLERHEEAEVLHPRLVLLAERRKVGLVGALTLEEAVEGSIEESELRRDHRSVIDELVRELRVGVEVRFRERAGGEEIVRADQVGIPGEAREALVRRIPPALANTALRCRCAAPGQPEQRRALVARASHADRR